MSKISYFSAVILFFFLGCDLSKRAIAFEEFFFDAFQNQGCLYALYHPTNADLGQKRKAFILELIDPIYQKVDSFIDPKSIIEFPGDENAYFLPIRDSQLNYHFKASEFQRNIQNKQQEGLLICYLKEPIKYQKFSKEELLTLNYSIPFDRLVKAGKIAIRYEKRKPKRSLKSTERYFESGYWTNLKATSSGKTGNGIQPILKKKMIALGYRLKDDDQHDKTLIAALKDFQRKHGLKPDGKLSFETLKKMGIEY